MGTTKSHQSRTVPLPRFLAAASAAAVAGRHVDQPVFTMPGGSVMRLSNWRRSAFIPARRRAGLSDRFRVHDLRHTAASLMIQAGYPPKMLQEILCHASITTTLDLYGHLYPGEMDRYAARLMRRPGCLTRPTMRPECGQMTTRLSRMRSDQRAYLRKHERARRDSNPQPSDP